MFYGCSTSARPDTSPVSFDTLIFVASLMIVNCYYRAGILIVAHHYTSPSSVNTKLFCYQTNAPLSIRKLVNVHYKQNASLLTDVITTVIHYSFNQACLEE